MNWKPKFYIVYPRVMVDQIQWNEGSDYRCSANLSSMLRDILKTKSIGSEIKLIWNNEHSQVIMDKSNVTCEEIDNYVRADSGMLSFLSKRTRKRACEALTARGGKNFICVDSYREVILQQAYFFVNKKFETTN